MEIVDHFAAHRSGWPATMTTPPGYHFAVIALGLGHPTLTTARATSALFACLALAAFAGAWRCFHGRPPGAVTLLVALLPILQPFTAMAYSDAAGLAMILCAWWAQVAQRRFLAAVLFALACLVRQTNAVWGVFMIALHTSPDLWPRPGIGRLIWRTAAAEIWREGKWLMLVLATGLGVVVYAGRVTPGTNNGNAFQPNVATLHFAGVLILLLGLPVWLAHATKVFRGWRDLSRYRTGPVLAWLGVALAATVVLALTFANPHVWNRDLWWPEVRFTLLRNWPLVAIDTHPWLRAVSALNLVLIAAALAVTFAVQPHRRPLWIAVGCGALLLGSNSLVEPRYFITPLVFVLFFLEWRAVELRRLIAWFALLCLAHAPFIIAGRSLW
jgi:hypothetical protein